MNEHAGILLIPVAVVTLYVIGVGGTTATAIRIREAWRHRKPDGIPMQLPPGGVLILSAPSLTFAMRWLRLVGWIAFPFALVLAVFENPTYPLVVPLTVVIMVGLNAFYFTVMQAME